MEKLGRVLFWLFLLLLTNCGSKKGPVGPNGPDKPITEPEKVALTATKPATEQDLAALQDSLPQNISISLSDLLGRELPDGQVFIGYYYVDADTAWRLNDFQGSSKAIKFYGPTFAGDFDGNGLVDLADFYKFADRFGRKAGQAGYDLLFDFDASGWIEWQDFWVFADFFGSVVDGAAIASAKPILLPKNPPEEGIGQMSYADLLKAWPSLTRAAKTVAVNRHYQFRIKSLDKAFADTTVKVDGEIFGNRQFAFPVNARPRHHSLGPLELTWPQGGMSKIRLTGLFEESDDPLTFSLAGDTVGFAIVDNFLAIPSAELKKFTLVIKATDTAGQFALHDVNGTIIARPDSAPPQITLSIQESTINFRVDDESDSVRVKLTVGDNIFLDDWLLMPVEQETTFISHELGTYPVRLVATDPSGNRKEFTGEIVFTDKIPPTMSVQTEWVGDRKNQLAINVALSDNTGLGDYRVTAGTLDYSGNGSGRQNLNFSPPDANFPTVTSVTTREIKLHVCDQAGNCFDSTTFVDQPISPVPPPPSGGGGTTTPPPATVVEAPTISATVNGLTGYIQVTAGEIMALIANVTGDPTVSWSLGNLNATGTNTTMMAPVGSAIMTVTATNSAGSVSQSFNILALGAPKRIVPTNPQ